MQLSFCNLAAQRILWATIYVIAFEAFVPWETVAHAKLSLNQEYDLQNNFLCVRRWAKGVVRKRGRTDLAGFEPDFTFSALSGYALYLWRHMISRDFSWILTGF